MLRGLRRRSHAETQYGGGRRIRSQIFFTAQFDLLRIIFIYCISQRTLRDISFRAAIELLVVRAMRIVIAVRIAIVMLLVLRRRLLLLRRRGLTLRFDMRRCLKRRWWRLARRLAVRRRLSWLFNVRLRWAK